MKKTSTGTQSSFQAELFRQNERKTNRLAAIALLIIGLLYSVLAELSSEGIINLISTHTEILIHISGMINVLIFFVIIFINSSHPIIKRIIIADILLSAMVVLFYFPLNASFAVYMAIVISALYYERRLIIATTCANWALYIGCMVANIILERRNENMQLFHSVQQVTLWQYPDEVVYYRIIPNTILFAVLCIVCCGIARRGKTLVLKQAEAASAQAVLKTELNVASGIQHSSLPAGTFVNDEGNLHISAVMQPAKQVGGDFYDYFTLGSNIVYLMADVSDKGLSAAMFMMKAKDAIRLAVSGGKNLEDAIADVNTLLCTNNKDNLFVTLWVGMTNIHTGIGKYINCGHLSPVVKHSDGSISVLENDPGLMLGVFEDIEIKSYPFYLDSNDTLLLYTDGLTDAMNKDGEALGEEHLRNFIESSPLSSDALYNSITEEFKKHIEGTDQFDDMTLMSVCYTDIAAPKKEIFRLKAESGSPEEAIEHINSKLAAIGCPEDTRRNIDVVIDEICTNIVEYAFPDGNGEYSISCWYGENFIKIRIFDKGIPFNPLETEEPDITGEPQIGGLGIHLVRSIMDVVEYSYEDGTNKLTLAKIWY